jgi:ABC-type transporter Mla subunit MlaD
MQLLIFNKMYDKYPGITWIDSKKYPPVTFLIDHGYLLSAGVNAEIRQLIITTQNNIDLITGETVAAKGKLCHDQIQPDILKLLK